MLRIDIQDHPDPEWDERLLHSNFGTSNQISEYGIDIKTRLKSKILFIKFYDEDKLVAQLLAAQSFRGRGRLANLFGWGFIYSAVSKASIFFPKHITWYSGPVIFNKSYTSKVSESLGNLLISLKSSFYGSVHPLDADFVFPTKFNFQKVQLSTFILDLKQDLNVILKNTDKKSVQNNIKRSIERGVTVKQIESKEDFVKYYELQRAFREKNQLRLYSKNDLLEAFEQNKKNGNSITLLAIYKGEPVGGINFASFNGYIMESGIARSEIDKEKILYSIDLLRWNIIEWGIKHNCRYYDLIGVKFKDRSAKEEGIFRNKRKWGGKLVHYHAFRG